MILGALIDLGLPIDDLRGALGPLAIDAGDIWTERVLRTGISATRFCVRGEQPARAHVHGTHGHDHPHHGGADEDIHRTLPEIYGLIDRSSLTPAAKERAKSLFATLGEAEAAIHGTPADQVHLHEVGALDSVVDIVGAVFAFEQLGADCVMASPLNVGSGTIRSAHGTYPVPAPATLRLLTDVPVYAGAQQAELVTPTGALLVSSYADRYGAMPAMKVRRAGYGAGARDFPDTPNVLRAVLGEDEGGGHAHVVSVVECEIDDMNPQIFGVLMDRLLAAGALDVFYIAVQMKKNRPGTLLTIVAPPAKREALVAIVFRETTTIGVRYREMTRECLEREEVVVQTPLGAVRFKVARRGDTVQNASPEFEDLLKIAERESKPIKDVQGMATKAFLDRPNPKSQIRNHKD
jgi:pyridinium-3,5-bisthiocarboxylic acid mononucleotide nickel chelatase